MKRALAERAKQHHGEVAAQHEQHQNQQHHRKAPKTSASSTPSQHVPRRKPQSPVPSAPVVPPSRSALSPPTSAGGKAGSAPPQSSSPRPSKPTPAASGSESRARPQSQAPKSAAKRRRSSQGESSSSSVNAGAAVPSSSSSSARRKRERRQRPPPAHASVVPSSDEDEGDEEKKNAFYLRHQNRALASELRQYKRSIDRLEGEREHRRNKCRDARERIELVAEVWRELEAAVATVASDEISPRWSHIKEEMNDEILGKGPGSTGTGGDVETVSGLLGAIVRLAETPSLLKSEGGVKCPSRIKSANRSSSQVKSEGGIGAPVKNADADGALDDEAGDKVALALSRRAESLRSSLLKVLRGVLDSSAASYHGPKDEGDDEDGPLNAASLHRQIASLENRCGELSVQMEELIKTRDDAAASEKRVRRGLYRLASGRMKVAEVLEVVEKEDGTSLFEEFAEEEAQTAPPASSTRTLITSLRTNSESGTGAPNGGPAAADGETVKPADILHLKKMLGDLEQIAESREKRISELILERDGNLKRINDLTLLNAESHSEASLSTEDVKRSTLYTDTVSKLSTVERKLLELKEEAEEMKKRWATSKGDLVLARKTMKEMEKKHVRRLKELATTGMGTVSDVKDGAADGDGKGLATMNGTKDHASRATYPKRDGSKCASEDMLDRQHLSDGARIIELEHKLKQALESVRQAETIRVSLNEANMMTEALQTKLEELKSKNATLVADKAAARASLDSSSSTAAHLSPHKYKDESRSSSSSSDRMQKEHRKMRKELAAAMASKEGAKSKQDRAERERDALMKTNARLLKQSAEKDDMNAKSLSTILHLNQLTEQLAQEKDLLEKRVKGAEQMALAARLAANAKERVQEEALREKEHVEEELRMVKKQTESVQTEREHIDGRLSQSKAKALSLVKNLSTVRERCDELTCESTNAAEEKTRLLERLAVAKKEASDASKKAAAVAAAAGTTAGGVRSRKSANSEFTMDQMETQVKVLKSRLACNVCNERDKQVILTRCRHMFCRQCVDKNIKVSCISAFSATVSSFVLHVLTWSALVFAVIF